MQPITNILQLRQYLAERLPELRLCTEQSLGRNTACWPTALPQIDKLLGGGLPKSTITELVSTKPSSGSALLLTALLRQAHASGQWFALIDAHDSFDTAVLGDEEFPRFIWVRCRGAAQALKAADLLLRDGNLSLVILDLGMSSAVESRKIPSTTWHRFQRLVKPASTALFVVAPQALVSSPHIRLHLEARFDLKALDEPHPKLVNHLRIRLAEQDDWLTAVG